MEVIGADGVHVGTVDRVEENRIKLTTADSGEGRHKGHHHYIDGSLVAILRLKPGSTQLEVWLENPAFEQPPQGAPGLDGIAFGGDGNLYVNTFAKGDFFRVDVKDGLPGKITKLKPSRPLKLPDGLRSTGGQTFVMAEGGGSVDRVTINGDEVEITTIKDGIAGPTSVVPVGQTLWVSEGQLPHLFEAAKSGPPHLPFRIIGVPMPSDVGQDNGAGK